MTSIIPISSQLVFTSFLRKKPNQFNIFSSSFQSHRFTPITTMASKTPKEVAVDMSPHFVVHTDGTIDQLNNPVEFIPASNDPNNAVLSKDIVISPKTGVSVRIFVPRAPPTPKLPLVVYIHGGAFCVGSSGSPAYHNFVSNIVERCGLIAVSVDYRLAPQNPLPIAFEDSWDAFRWVAVHARGEGEDPWLNEYADFGRVFLGGESAGAMIANDVAIRAGVEKFRGLMILGMFLVHPLFGGKEVDKLYKFLCPTSSGCDDDPRLNPAVDPRIRHMAGRRVVFFVADKDPLGERAKAYYNGLKKSEWSGEVEIFETKGEGHCFYLFDTNSKKAVAIVNRLVRFLSRP